LRLDEKDLAASPTIIYNKPEDSFGFTCGVLLIRSTKFVAYNIISTTFCHLHRKQYKVKTLLMATWKLAPRTGWRLLLYNTHTHTDTETLYIRVLYTIWSYIRNTCRKFKQYHYTITIPSSWCFLTLQYYANYGVCVCVCVCVGRSIGTRWHVDRKCGCLKLYSVVVMIKFNVILYNMTEI